MDTESLLENQIDAGQKLLELLPQSGIAVAAAFWLTASVDCRWRFFLVSPVVDVEGLIKAYRRLHLLTQQMAGALFIDPLGIKLIGLDDPIAKDVLAIWGPRVSPVRWSGRSLGNVIIEDAYLYPPPGAAA